MAGSWLSSWANSWAASWGYTVDAGGATADEGGGGGKRRRRTIKTLRERLEAKRRKQAIFSPERPIEHAPALELPDLGILEQVQELQRAAQEQAREQILGQALEREMLQRQQDDDVAIALLLA